MAVEKVKNFFKKLGEPEKVKEFEKSTATSEEAAEVLKCEVGRIAKTISLKIGEKAILVVISGDKKLDNKKFREKFKSRPKMIPVEEVEKLIGHAVGGVCPFAINEGVEIFLDESLKRYESIYPAAGSSNSVVEIKLEEIGKYINFSEWIDVSRAK